MRRREPNVFPRLGGKPIADIDPGAAEWCYVVTRTNPHIVPLSRQAVAILREQQPLTCSEPQSSRFLEHIG